MATPQGWEDRNRQQFDALAGGYDRLGFLARVAAFVADRVGARPGQAALDVMTGTGGVALALTGQVGAGQMGAGQGGAGGSVVGLDLSAGIISGTFAFTLAQPGCDTIKVTQGRFDKKL